MNILTELLGYSHTALFHKIKGNCEFPADLKVSGDAVSHLGRSLNTTLCPPESHAEKCSCLTPTKLQGVLRTDKGFASPEPFASGCVPSFGLIARF